MELIQILSIVVSAIILITVIEFIRRGAFKEKYALLWLFSSIVLLILAIWRDLLHYLAGIFGFFYPPSFLFVIGLGFLMLITLHFSVVISNLSDKNRELAQEISLLNGELERFKSEKKASQGDRQPGHQK